jgi:uncharacterized membrane protein
MSMKRSLQIIAGIALFGLCFSGYLSYQELFSARPASCPAFGAPGTVLGQPACVYGFFMYLAVLVVAGLGLRARKS